jgi:hypothetical protein
MTSAANNVGSLLVVIPDWGGISVTGGFICC